MKNEIPIGNPSAFEIVSQVVAALSAQDTKTMASLHARDFVVDWVYGDAFENPPSSAAESAAFFPAWFAGFDEIDYDVKRTIAAEEVAVTEWVFTGMSDMIRRFPDLTSRRPSKWRTGRLNFLAGI